MGCAAWASGPGGGRLCPLGSGALHHQQLESGSVKGSGPKGEGREPSRKEERVQKESPAAFPLWGTGVYTPGSPEIASAHP